MLTAVSSGPVENAKKGLYGGGNRPKPPEHEYIWKAVALDFQTGNVIWETELHKGVPEVGRHIINS